jgi:RNA polymerase sigma factor (sigma-70 family)
LRPTWRATRCAAARRGVTVHHQSYESLELVAEQEQVEETLDHDIARQIISQTLLRLPSRYREVFNLHVEGHLSYRAIARRLGVSTKTVERDMRRRARAVHGSIRPASRRLRLN